MNKIDSFVEPVGYHSYQIKSDGTASFRRSDTESILICDRITMDSRFLENVVFYFNEFSTALLSVPAIHACSPFTKGSEQLF